MVPGRNPTRLSLARMEKVGVKRSRFDVLDDHRRRGDSRATPLFGYLVPAAVPRRPVWSGDRATELDRVEDLLVRGVGNEVDAGGCPTPAVPDSDGRADHAVVRALGDPRVKAALREDGEHATGRRPARGTSDRRLGQRHAHHRRVERGDILGDHGDQEDAELQRARLTDSRTSSDTPRPLPRSKLLRLSPLAAMA